MEKIPIVFLSGKLTLKGYLIWSFDDEISINDIIVDHSIIWENKEYLFDYPIKIEANYYDAKTGKKYYLINFCDALGF